MKVAFLSDIHGNLPALEAALTHAADCDVLVTCGDYVGYYADPEEVCDCLRVRAVPAVVGNHDLMVLGRLPYDEIREELYRVRWTRSRLSKASTQWLGGLPNGMEYDWEGFRVSVRHASPWDMTTYLYESSPNLDRIRLATREILVVGHTHHSALVRLGSGVLLNPGSVGQPRSGPAGASYAVLDTESAVIEHRTAQWDWASYQARLRSLGWQELLIERLANPNRREPMGQNGSAETEPGET